MIDALEYVRHMSAPERFRYFVRERETARMVKEGIGGEGPHSGDPIIAVNRFCNINREDDAVTRWVKVHVRDHLVVQEQGRGQAVIQLLAARIWNHPPTLERILPIIKPSVALQKLRAIRASGEKTMRGAYMMPVHGVQGTGKSADEYYMEAVAAAMKVNWYGSEFDELRFVADALVMIPGIGDFLANQVIADLRHTPYWLHAPDRSTFVLCGPGTRRGLDRYDSQGRGLGGRAQGYYCTRLLEVRQHLLDQNFYNTVFYDPNNLANCFCEFDKYERVLHGEVRQLRKYP